MIKKKNQNKGWAIALSELSLSLFLIVLVLAGILISEPSGGEISKLQDSVCSNRDNSNPIYATTEDIKFLPKASGASESSSLVDNKAMILKVKFEGKKVKVSHEGKRIPINGLQGFFEKNNPKNLRLDIDEMVPWEVFLKIRLAMEGQTTMPQLNLGYVKKYKEEIK
jgi:hypothetical protein